MESNITTAAEGTVGIGFSALAALTTGAGNVAVGYMAMLEETLGDYNTVVGYGAMNDSLSGLENDNNTFIGYNSGGGTWLTAASTGNTAVGSGTMIGAMMASNYNTAIGFSALAAVTLGDGNTAVGRMAGDSVTDGDYNTFLGYQAGTEGIGFATGDNCTLVGAFADTSATDSTNQTAIGYDCNAVVDDSVTLGNGNVTAVYMGDESQATVHCTGILNSARAAVSVSTSATAISVAAQYGGLAMVWMNSAGNIAHDLVSYSLSGVDLLATQTISGGPVGRTYSAVSGVLKVAMASGTYDVYATEIRVS